ncbi:MAG: STAS domain-containing protein [Planctomycetaceae bacterium]|jgi:anti-sigma B factor antagonist
MSGQQEMLQVYQGGELTVVGFGGREILGQIDITKCRSQLLELIKNNATKTLAFDLRGVKLLPSGMLGLMASLLKMKIAIHVYSPSNDVREVLKVTGLTKVITIHDLEGDGNGTT